jgi:hypothetical protein
LIQWTTGIFLLNKHFRIVLDLSFTLYEILKESLFSTTQKRRSLRKGLENTKAHLKLSFLRDKYIPLKSIHFQLIIITNVSILTDPAYFVPPSCHCYYSCFEVKWLLRVHSKRKTPVLFVYVIPDVLHGDILSEIKYLVNLEWNILQILTRNVIFFYSYSNWGELHSTFSSFSCKQTEHMFYC